MTATAPAAGTTPAPPSAVKFSVPSADTVQVDCPGASATGPSWALVHEPRPGTCHVTATFGATEHATDVRLGMAPGYTCTLDGDTLTCR